MRAAILLISTLALTGCVATTAELHSASADMTGTMQGIEQDQVLRNLVTFAYNCTSLKHCDALPQQFVLGSGQAQVSNQVQSPNITANFHGRAVQSLAFQNQNQWTQTWSLVPVSDFSDLQRLRDLYEFAVLSGEYDEAGTPKYSYSAFADDYIKIPLGGQPNLYLPISALGTVSGLVDYYALPLPLPGVPTTTAATVARSGKWSGTAPDTWPFPLPFHKWIYVDGENLPEGKHQWVVGRIGTRSIHVRRSDLYAFMIWIRGATIDTNESSKSGGGKPPGLLLNAQ